MGFRSIIYNAVRRFAERLGMTVQDGPEVKPPAFLSAQDMMTIKLSNMVLNQFAMPVNGENARALWLDGQSDSFIRDRLLMAVKKSFDTGDCLVVPSWTDGGVVENHIIDGDSFTITGAYGDTLTGIVYRADAVKVGSTLYELMVSVGLERNGNGGYDTVYRSYVTRDGNTTTLPLNTVPKWGGIEPEWGITNTDRLLVGRLKSPTYDDRAPNNVKGTPICYRAEQPMREIAFLLDMLHDEMELSEKFVTLPKNYFQQSTRLVKNADGTTTEVKTPVLPKGKNRIIMAVSGSNLDGSDKPFEWSPTIREESIINALEEQYRAFENAVGVSPGVLSKMNDANYSNVDNVRKTTINTQNFIGGARNKCETFLLDLVNAWDVLADFYTAVPMGQYEVSFNWSDDYINTYQDHLNMLSTGIALGAISPADYREWAMKEPPDVAQEKVDEIARNSATQIVGE